MNKKSTPKETMKALNGLAFHDDITELKLIMA